MIEANNTRQLEDYQSRLFNIQNSLDIQQARFFEIVSRGEHIRLLQTEHGSADYLNKIDKELRKLKAPIRIQYYIQGLEKLSQIKEEILQCGRVEQQINNSLAYENPRLAKKMADQKNSQKLDLSDEHLNDEDMKILAEKYHETTTLTTLGLQSNKIGDKGSLEELYLQQNLISTNGIKDLADALKENTTLTTLNLSWNRIGDKGAEHIAVALRENKALVTLDLQQNYIGCLGASYIADALRINTVIQIFNV
ncbi:unnamed protein product [Rotaria sp. Silwood2]|nr:unnamed protein product [Rotaria sp. Silwood2]